MVAVAWGKVGVNGGGDDGGGGRTLVERIQEYCKVSSMGRTDKEKYGKVKSRNNLI